MKKNLKGKMPQDTKFEVRGTKEPAFETCTLCLVLMMFLLTACTKNDTAHEHDTYTCPMHPTVISDRPGTCPVCGMELVLKARVGGEVEITEDLSKLLTSPN